MDEINKKLDLILSSQVVIQTEVIRLNSKIDNLDERVNKRIDDLDEKVNKRIDGSEEKFDKRINDLDEKFTKRINDLDQKYELKFETFEETLEKDRKDIADIFNGYSKENFGIINKR